MKLPPAFARLRAFDFSLDQPPTAVEGAADATIADAGLTAEEASLESAVAGAPVSGSGWLGAGSGEEDDVDAIADFG